MQMNTDPNPAATSAHRRRSERVSEAVVAGYIDKLARGQHPRDRHDASGVRPPAADDGARIRLGGVQRPRTARSRARGTHSRVADAPLR